MLDNVPWDDIVKAYKESDLYIPTSKIEYSVIVILEAMVANLPYGTREVGCGKGMRDALIGNKPRNAAEAINRILKDGDLKIYLVNQNCKLIDIR